MDDILSLVFLNNTLAQWLIAAAFVIGGFIAGKIGALIVRKILAAIFNKKKEYVDAQIVKALEGPLALLVFLLGTFIGTHRLNLNETVILWIDRVVNSFLIIIITWALTRALDKIIIRFVPHDGKTNMGKIDAGIQPLVRKFTGTVLWIIAVVLILRTLGYNVTALMAGLGLGGAALALASKDTLSNFFGSITVFFDRPFRLNDRIRIGSYDGEIIEMGLRTSRLKTLENRTVFIPNSIFAAQPIENISAQPNIKVVQTIGFLGYNGSKKIARGLEIIREIAAANLALEGGATVGLVSVSAVNCQASFTYFVSKKADYTETVNQVNIEILRRFEEEEIRLA